MNSTSYTIGTSVYVNEIVNNLSLLYDKDTCLSIINDKVDTLVNGLSEFLTAGNKPNFELLTIKDLHETNMINISNALIMIFQIINSFVSRLGLYNVKFKYRGLNSYNVVLEVIE